MISPILLTTVLLSGPAAEAPAPPSTPRVVIRYATTPSPYPTDRLQERMDAYLTLPIRDCGDTCLIPTMAVEQGAGAAPAPAPAADYSFIVEAVGSDDGLVFINSQRDYRDQRNLTLALSPRVDQQLRERFAPLSIEEALIGKRIVVRGRPERVRIEFRENDRPTGLYYYQTHIRVGRLEQLSRPIPPPF